MAARSIVVTVIETVAMRGGEWLLVRAPFSMWPQSDGTFQIRMRVSDSVEFCEVFSVVRWVESKKPLDIGD